MSVLPAKHSSDFYEKFTEANKLYEEVKEIVIYAEYENKDQKYLISAVNELRNAFDHIMRIVSEPHSIDTNFEKARGHIYRAGYDAYEIIAISKLNNIKDVKEQFSYNAIIEAYPVYHSSVIPSVEKAKKELVKARAHKKINGKKEEEIEVVEAEERKHFENFEAIVTELTKIVDDINLHIAGISEADINMKKAKSKELRNKIIVFILASILLPLGFLFLNYYLNHKECLPTTKVPTTTTVPAPK